MTESVRLERARQHKHYAEILGLLTEGYSLVAIRRITGYEDAPRFVHKVPELEDLWKANKAEAEAKDSRDREQTMKEDLARKTFYRIEYLGGYVNSDSTVRLRCVECSGEFQYTVDFIKRSDTFIECPYCRQTDKDRSDRLKRRVEARKREADRTSREFRKAYELERKKVCSGCGCRVDRPGRLCDACRLEKKRAQWKANEIRRKRLIDSQACIDKSITLRRLSDRDKGICYICGGLVNWEDYRIENGQKLSGNTYPSIDHVIPLAHGGAHTWDNVRLAHRLCNSVKSDSVPTEQMYPRRS